MEHFDLAAFYGGSATELYRTLGAHRTPDGWVFRVWAPHAGSVSVVGDFCAWDPPRIRCAVAMAASGETEVAGLSPYDTYKFAVTAQSGAVTFKPTPTPSTPRRAPARRASSTSLRATTGATARTLRQSSRSMTVRSTSTRFTSARGGGAKTAILRLPLARGRAERVRRRPRLQLRGADARDRVSARRLVGLPVHRLLRADLALRHAARLHVLRGHDAPKGHLRHS